MKVRQNRHFSVHGTEATTVGRAIECIVENANSYDDGRLEALQARVDKLASLVGVLLEQLPEEVQLKTLNAISYAWEKVDDA